MKRYKYSDTRAKRVYEIACELRKTYLELYMKDSEIFISAKKENSSLLSIYKQRRRESLERAGACTSLARIFFNEYSEEAWDNMLVYIDIHEWKEGDRIQAVMVKEILALVMAE